MAKYGSVKRRHGRVTGLDEILDRIVRDCPHVTRIIPGRMGRKRGKNPGGLQIQYATARGSAPPNGLKCIYTRQGSWQEVFLVCDDAAEARRWLESSGVAT
jgi:Predicted metal-binding protein (DUF2103)